MDRHFFNLDIGLPVETLRQPIRACISDGRDADVALEAVNRRGRPIRCRIACTPLTGPGQEARGAIIVMEELAGERAI